jgi:signal transduction histidine kinase
LGFSQLLKANITQYSQEEIVHRAEKIHASADRLHTLLENLLMWSQLQRGVMEYTPETIQLHPLAYETLELFRPHADQKEITLTLDVPQQLSAYADYSMINTVIRNLTSNALKFTAEQGEVTIMARGNGHTVEFHVTDTGVGIPEEHLPLLFRIDTQYTNPGTQGEQGTGLGLILCRELVEKNHGIIWVESEPEKGTSFRFTLPCHPVT